MPCVRRGRGIAVKRVRLQDGGLGGEELTALRWGGGLYSEGIEGTHTAA